MQKKEHGWVLLKTYKPSEKTKKSLNLDDDERYFVYMNTFTGQIVCDCPGFVFMGYCKHSKYWEQIIEEWKLKRVVN
ncbi:MAG: hypothetical protein KatS3mg096_805 [Candidatus Parcubacteria bacterium]|nr:MAG: hypothetical protein KatS3mg096_805 [Candidatus Parcubacteria bacterium]